MLAIGDPTRTARPEGHRQHQTETVRGRETMRDWNQDSEKQTTRDGNERQRETTSVRRQVQARGSARDSEREDERE